MNAQPATTGLLGDTPERDYARKLTRFNAFAETELRSLIAGLQLKPGMRVLDAGCGTGEALHWLLQKIAPGGAVVGVDLAAAHVEVARKSLAPGMTLLQGDLLQLDLPHEHFDLVWSVNTVNHLREPVRGVQALASFVRPGGCIALGQSSFVPDMFFAWDSRLERVTNEAVRHYYHDRYGLDENAITGVRGLVGLLHRAGLERIQPHTIMIERTAPLREPDEAYLLETIFRETWGERLRPYLSAADWASLERTCNPLDPQFALRRPDFHFLQSFTLVRGHVRASTTDSPDTRQSAADGVHGAARKRPDAKGS